MDIGKVQTLSKFQVMCS